MKLTTKEAKHLIEELTDRQTYDELCDYELSILYKARKAYPLAVAELEIADLNRQYQRLANYNGELYQALENGTTLKEFKKQRKEK